MFLFHNGTELFDRFSISLESEIMFSDYCTDLIFPYKHNIRFTSKALLFSFPKEGFNNVNHDWFEVDRIEFMPWESVLGFRNLKGTKALDQFDQAAIINWLSGINDPIIDYPYIDVGKGHIAFIVNGKPRSMRSVGGKRSFRKKVENKVKEIQTIYPSPFHGNVEMKIDVFSSNPNSTNMPDVDRLSGLITDAFQNIAYIDDKQIRDLRPRVIDVSHAFRKLECRTEPMGCLELTDIPIGSVFPLAIGETEYYVIRIGYYN